MTSVNSDQVIAALKKVYDPEMPVNIYELGLIYEVDVDESGQVHIRMTLTAPNCPVAGTLPAEVEREARAVPGVTDVKAGTDVRSALDQGPDVRSGQTGARHRRHHSDREAATMKLTANEEYGLRCLVRLGYAGPRRQPHASPRSARPRASRGVRRQDPADPPQGRLRQGGARQRRRLHAGAAGGGRSSSAT